MSAAPVPDRPAAPLLPQHPPPLPLPDEPHIDAWLAYERDARQQGGFETLRRRFVQLRFPILAGISLHEAYRAATRRGMFAEADAFAPGLVLASPGTVEVSVVATIAGRVPVITAGDRTDFVALVQAFTERNEPTPLPSSMGACLVAGFNNWDRIAAYRTAWERAHPEGSIGETWAEAFERLVPQKPLYQDRFVILSRGPYSGVGAERTGFDDEAWLDRSLIIRREHECTHYFVYRLTGMLPRSVMDELVADFVGLVRACGGYRTDLALRFLGLDAYPPYRPGGRLENYRGTLGIGTAAFEDVARLTASAVQQLAEVAAFFHRDLQALDGLARLAFALSRLSLDECARPGLPERLARPSIPA